MPNAAWPMNQASFTGPVRPLSDTARRRLLEAVHAQPHPLLVNALLIAVTGGICWNRAHDRWMLAWLAVGLLLSIFRLWDWWMFHTRPAHAPIEPPRRRFIGLAWLIGAHWGLASFALLRTTDPFAQFLAITTQSAFVSNAIARNHQVYPAALGQVYFTLLPLACACMLSPDHFMHIFAALALLHIASAHGTARQLYQQSLHMLTTDEDKARLLEDIKDTNTKLENANEVLLAMASTDGLTGIPNRRCFDRTLTQECKRAQRTRGTLGLLLIDIDEFKAYNDSLGHQAGDACLREVAACIAQATRRTGDLAARYGGEEFGVILPETDRLAVMARGEAIRAAVQNLRLPHPASGAGIVTISVGACALGAHEMLAADMIAETTLLSWADNCLYRAKGSGRNCVRGLEEPERLAVAE